MGICINLMLPFSPFTLTWSARLTDADTSWTTHHHWQQFPNISFLHLKCQFGPFTVMTQTSREFQLSGELAMICFHSQCTHWRRCLLSWVIQKCYNWLVWKKIWKRKKINQHIHQKSFHMKFSSLFQYNEPSIFDTKTMRKALMQIIVILKIKFCQWIQPTYTFQCPSFSTTRVAMTFGVESDITSPLWCHRRLGYYSARLAKLSS